MTVLALYDVHWLHIRATSPHPSQLSAVAVTRFSCQAQPTRHPLSSSSNVGLPLSFLASQPHSLVLTASNFCSQLLPAPRPAFTSPVTPFVQSGPRQLCSPSERCHHCRQQHQSTLLAIIMAHHSSTGIPLHCNICPKKPNFSDTSHLLTHVASKQHLSNYFKLRVRVATDPAAQRDVDDYDRWYQDWNLDDLMRERMNQKERRNKGGSGGGSRRASAGSCTNHHSTW